MRFFFLLLPKFDKDTDVNKEGASSELLALHLGHYYLHFLPKTGGTKELLSAGHAQCHWEVGRGELGRARKRAPNYKVTRENQSLLELSWYWRPRAHQTLDQCVFSGRRRRRREEEWRRRREPGQDIAPKKVCHTVFTSPPTLKKILLPFHMFQFGCSGWLPVKYPLNRYLLVLVFQLSETPDWWEAQVISGLTDCGH